MRLWPASLRSRLMLMIFFTLLLANALTLSLLLYERMSSARSVMLGSTEYDVATSVAILTDFPPPSVRSGWRGWRVATIATGCPPASADTILTAGVPAMRCVLCRKR